MVKKNNYFTGYIFCLQFHLSSCGENNILPNLTNIQEPEPVFCPLEPEPLEKNTKSRSRLKKNREPEPLEKNRELNNLPAPQPCFIHIPVN